MSRHPFGWDLPPGVTSKMIDEAAGGSEICAVCEKHYDDCRCPECPVCGEVGDPLCYEKHGLERPEVEEVVKKD